MIKSAWADMMREIVMHYIKSAHPDGWIYDNHKGLQMTQARGPANSRAFFKIGPIAFEIDGIRYDRRCNPTTLGKYFVGDIPANDINDPDYDVEKALKPLFKWIDKQVRKIDSKAGV
jgi:hypothetical protein